MLHTCSGAPSFRRLCTSTEAGLTLSRRSQTAMVILPSNHPEAAQNCHTEYALLCLISVLLQPVTAWARVTCSPQPKPPRPTAGHCPELARLPPALALLRASSARTGHWPSRSFQPGSQSRHRLLFHSLTRLPAYHPARRDPLQSMARSCTALQVVASRPPTDPDGTPLRQWQLERTQDAAGLQWPSLS